MDKIIDNLLASKLIGFDFVCSNVNITFSMKDYTVTEDRDNYVIVSDFGEVVIGKEPNKVIDESEINVAYSIFYDNCELYISFPEIPA